VKADSVIKASIKEPSVIPTISHQQSIATSSEATKNRNLLAVIAYGRGDELLSLRDLKASGSHPFSNSTRHRKIRNNEYPEPIKISTQMCLWRVADIRTWLNDPTGYKANVLKGTSK
jgi:predicted DNA-binding transcriptional regulator AlpA